MIIATVSQKGGVGKSTSTVHLVTWFREQNIQAALVDADVQSSSSIWAKELDPATLIYRLQSSDEILDEMKSILEKVIIIDGPAGLGEVTRSILLVDTSAQRRKNPQENWSQQDIVSEAISSWFKMKTS